MIIIECFICSTIHLQLLKTDKQHLVNWKILSAKLECDTLNGKTLEVEKFINTYLKLEQL
jgi:hypothetical protein